VSITVSENALNGYHGHGSHDGDLIPAPAGGCPGGSKGGGHGHDHDHKDDDCDDKDHEVPPVEVPPVEVPPVVTPPVVVPPVVAPPAVIPPAVVAVPAGAAAAPVVNRGFNAQTAAGTQTDSGNPAWFGGLAALLGATGLVALRHRARLQDFQK
jgi:hypothetical protein